MGKDLIIMENSVETSQKCMVIDILYGISYDNVGSE